MQLALTRGKKGDDAAIRKYWSDEASLKPMGAGRTIESDAIGAIG
jgi:hypothetical protein